MANIRISGYPSAGHSGQTIRLFLHPSDGSYVDVPIEKIKKRETDEKQPNAVLFEVSDDASLTFGKTVSTTIEAKYLEGAIKGKYGGEVAPEVTLDLARFNLNATGISCTFGCCESTAVSNFGCSDTRGCCACTVGTAQTVSCWTC